MPASPRSAPSCGTQDAAIAQPTRHLARQPILTREQKVYGYELLFRSGPESLFFPQHANNRRAGEPGPAGSPTFAPEEANCCGPACDLDEATRHTIDMSILFGSAPLAGSRL